MFMSTSFDSFDLDFPDLDFPDLDFPDLDFPWKMRTLLWSRQREMTFLRTLKTWRTRQDTVLWL